MRGHKFTEEEIKWVKDKYLSTLLTCKEIALEFNELFDTSDYYVTEWAIADLMNKRLKIKRGTNRGRFGQGINDKKQAPIGTIMKEATYGSTKSYVRIKVNCVKRVKGTKKSYYNVNYAPYHRFLYEQAHGKLKPGEFVIFADGDTHNFSLDNLIKINRRINGALQGKGYHGKGKITEAFVECKNLEEVMESVITK